MLRHNRPRTMKAPRKMPDNPKPKLKAFAVPVFRVHYKELEDYVQKVFGFEFDFLMATGLTEGMCPEYVVDGSILDGRAGSSEWDRRAADLRNGRRTKDIRLILAVLCKDGYIPKGRYTVSTHPLPDPVQQYTQLVYDTRDPNSPQCVAFKAQHKTNPVFVQRAAILDKAWASRMESNG